MPFLKYNANPLDRRGNDCTIRAISLFTGKTWDEVYIGVTAEGFDLKDMPSTNEIWNRYLKRLGYRPHTLPDTCPDCYTVKDFVKDYPEGRYLLCTGDHVIFAIITAKDGLYVDTWDSGDRVPIYYYQEV